jgi:hypothetical protein
MLRKRPEGHPYDCNVAAGIGSLRCVEQTAGDRLDSQRRKVVWELHSPPDAQRVLAPSEDKCGSLESSARLEYVASILTAANWDSDMLSLAERLSRNLRPIRLSRGIKPFDSDQFSLRIEDRWFPGTCVHRGWPL